MGADRGARLALVAGTSGLIGRRVAAHLAAGGWEVIGASRRPPRDAPHRALAVDLTDAGETRAKLAELAPVTHVFYAARYDHPEGVTESEAVNTAMLRNLLDGLAAGAHALQHVNLVHGTKHYGHPEPVPAPVTEECPRGAGPTFYHAQEDLVCARAAREGWTWSIARPHTFFDAAADNPRSLGLVIAVYAAVQRELGAPLFFPGSARAFAARTQFTDLGLLARALAWMATEPRCANQAFNVVNGDYPRWDALWPHIARALGIEPGPPQALQLARYMADKGPVWESVLARHGLQRCALDRIALWAYGDYVFRPEWDIMSAMDRARRCGFESRVDSMDMFARTFAAYRAQRIIP